MSRRLPLFFAAVAAVAGLAAGAPVRAAGSVVSRELVIRIDGTAQNCSVASAPFPCTHRAGAGSPRSRASFPIAFPGIASAASSTTGAVRLTVLAYTLPSPVTATGPQGGAFTIDGTRRAPAGPPGDGALFRCRRTGGATDAPAPFTNPDRAAPGIHLPLGASVDPGNPSFQAGPAPDPDVDATGAAAMVPAPAAWLPTGIGVASIDAGSRRCRTTAPRQLASGQPT